MSSDRQRHISNVSLPVTEPRLTVTIVKVNTTGMTITSKGKRPETSGCAQQPLSYLKNPGHGHEIPECHVQAIANRWKFTDGVV
ncbi:MAG TPA: hypothetical protein DER64_10685 [Planctomycetaceae bacterium]|nr:hypothetical protein [Planctomycetaceae bacterium]